MAQRDPLDDLPAVPPSAPGDNEFDSPANMGGGYLAGSDDQEIRKIRRRVTPLGKAVFVFMLAAGGGTAYFIVKSSNEEAAIARLTTEGRAQLQRITETVTDRAELTRRVREVYQNNRAPEVRMSARRILAGANDPQAVPLLIEGLRGTAQERRQAALGLAEIGLPAAQPARPVLLEVLPRTQPLVDRVEVVWACVVLGEQGAWDRVLDMMGSGQLQTVTNLDDPPRRIFDAALVARLAGPQRLIGLVSDSRVAIRRMTAVALAELATPEVLPALLTLSRDNDTDVAREATIGLARTGSEQAGDAISAFLNRHPDARDGVLNALSSSSGAPGLGVVMRTSVGGGTAAETTARLETRSMATRLLRELQDPGAGDAFMQVLSTTAADATDLVTHNMRNAAIFGLAEIGDPRAATGLLDLIGRPLVPGAAVDPNADSDARQALAALIRIPGAPAQAKTQLLALLPRAEFVRTQVLIALAASEDPAVGEPAMRYLADAQSQEGAAIAVSRTHYAPGMARVRTDMRRPPNLRMVDETAVDEDVFIRRRNAIQAIAWSHDPTVAPDLIRIIEDPLDRRLLREVAGHSLAAIANDQILEDIGHRAVDTTKPEEVRLYYLFALRGRSTPAISNSLVQTYLRPGVSAPVMRAAAIAAGFGGDDSTAALLRPLLRSDDASIKLNAAIAAVLCGDPATAAELINVLTSDRELPDLLANVFVTRSSTGINTGVQLEPFELLPLTESMFTDGRIYRRINMATTLERGRGSSHFDFAMVWLKIRIRQGWEDNVLGIGRFAIRQRLREAAQGTDEFRQSMAFRVFRALNDKGSLLALRRGTGPAAERARQLLVEMSASQ